MPALHDLSLSSTKHRSSERPGDDVDIQHVAKKRKLHHPSRPPAHFWDKLSQLVLTKNALRELDRRNAAEPRLRLRLEDQRRRPRTRRKTQPLSAQELLKQSSPTERAELRRFARHGGPDLRDVRGYPLAISPEMSSSQSSLGRRKRGSRSMPMTNVTSNTTTTRSTGPYDRAFQQHLIDYSIFPPGYEYPDGRELPEPENMDEIRQALRQPRASLSPSRFTKEDFKKFRRADDHASKESRVIASVIPIIEGDPGDRRCVASDVPFSNLDHLTDGSLVAAKPDLYYGARPEKLHRRVRQELSDLIVPSSQEDLPVAPNNFVEVKGPDGSLSVSTRQAQYDVALGSRGLHSLRSYGAAEPCYDNKAYSLAWTYHGGTLKAYASHPIPPSTPGAPPGYVMTQIRAFAMTDDPGTFRQGAAAYRNGKDWTRKQRDEAIAQANNKATSIEVADKPSDALRLARRTPRGGRIEAAQGTKKDCSPLRHDPDTSEDELSLDFERPGKRSRSLAKQPSTVASTPTEHDADQRGKDVNLAPSNRVGDEEE